MFDQSHTIRAIGARAALALVLGAAIVVAACGGSTGGSSTTGNTLSGKSLAIDGSSALAPLFQDAAKSFDAKNGTQTTVTPNGSGTGLKDVEAGSVQIGMSDVYAIEKAPAGSPHAYDDLVDHQVAVVAFTLIVSPDLSGKVSSLTTAQIVSIYTGAITNWKDAGGPDEVITVINRPTSSGTRATFKKYILGGKSESASNAQTQATSAQVAAAVSGAHGAIAYDTISFAQKNNLPMLSIDGAAPTTANINNGTYKFWSYEHAYTKGQPAGAAKAFLDYVMSDTVQNTTLAADGFYKVGTLTQAAKDTHPAPTPAP
ncbi:MAG: phosphate ABC transporter substrate-binding protein PstS family protein [Ktedonobacterales bacterium]